MQRPGGRNCLASAQGQQKCQRLPRGRRTVLEVRSERRDVVQVTGCVEWRFLVKMLIIALVIEEQWAREMSLKVIDIYMSWNYETKRDQQRVSPVEKRKD